MAYTYNPKPYKYVKKNIPGGRDKELLNYRVEGDVKAQAAKLTRAFKKMGGKGGLVHRTNKESVKWVARQAVRNLEESIKSNARPGRFNSGKLARVVRNEDSHAVSTVGFRFMDENKVRKQIDYAFSLEYGDRSQIGRDIYFLFLGKSPNRRTRKDTNRSQTKNDRDRQQAGKNFQVRSDNAESFRFSHRPSLRRSTHPYFGVAHHTNADGNNSQRVSDRLIGPRQFRSGGKGGGGFKSKHIANGKRFQVRIKNPVPQYRYGRKAGKQFVDEDHYLRLLNEAFAAGPEKAAGIEMTPSKQSRKSRPKSRSRKKSSTKKFPVTTRPIGT